jgi:hypothetical protein
VWTGQLSIALLLGALLVLIYDRVQVGAERTRLRSRELATYAALAKTDDPARSLYLGLRAPRVGDQVSPILISVFDDALAAGTARISLSGHTSGVASVAFSSDGMMLASSSLDGTVKLWDPESGAERHVLVSHKTSRFQTRWPKKE